MQKLSKRLQAVADLVTPGSTVADVGTDHGFLPIYLIQSGKCPGAIAMDIRKGPLERAWEHILAAGLEQKIQIRLSDGMKELAAEEADSVVIAGMGGLTVIHILEDAQDQLSGVRELILEPQSDIAKVRRYLREHKFGLDKEDLVYEAGKFYPILHVVTKITEPEQVCRKDRQQMQDILLEKLADEKRVRSLFDQYGACMIYGRRPALRQLLQRDEKRELEILRALEEGAGSVAKERKRAVEKRLEEIRALLEMDIEDDQHDESR